jgi:hypothetical protein
MNAGGFSGAAACSAAPSTFGFVPFKILIAAADQLI